MRRGLRTIARLAETKEKGRAGRAATNRRATWQFKPKRPGRPLVPGFVVCLAFPPSGQKCVAPTTMAMALGWHRTAQAPESRGRRRTVPPSWQATCLDRAAPSGRRRDQPWFLWAIELEPHGLSAANQPAPAVWPRGAAKRRRATMDDISVARCPKLARSSSQPPLPPSANGLLHLAPSRRSQAPAGTRLFAYIRSLRRSYSKPRNKPDTPSTPRLKNARR